jgi:SulP family sulfate permease
MERLVPTDDGHFQTEAVPTQLPDAEPVILNVSGSLFHASLKRLEELLPSPDRSYCPVVILRLRDHENLGSTGVRILLRYTARLNAQGGRLYLAGIHPHISVELKRTSMLEKIGTDSVFESTPMIFGATEQALVAARAWIAEQPNRRLRRINSSSVVDDPARGDVSAPQV